MMWSVINMNMFSPAKIFFRLHPPKMMQPMGNIGWFKHLQTTKNGSDWLFCLVFQGSFHPPQQSISFEVLIGRALRVRAGAPPRSLAGLVQVGARPGKSDAKSDLKGKVRYVFFLWSNVCVLQGGGVLCFCWCFAIEIGKNSVKKIEDFCFGRFDKRIAHRQLGWWGDG